MVGVFVAHQELLTTLSIVRVQLLVFAYNLLLGHALGHKTFVKEGDHKLILSRRLLYLWRARFLDLLFTDVLGAIGNFWLLVAQLGTLMILV